MCIHIPLYELYIKFIRESILKFERNQQNVIIL